MLPIQATPDQKQAIRWEMKGRKKRQVSYKIFVNYDASSCQGQLDQLLEEAKHPYSGLQPPPPACAQVPGSQMGRCSSKGVWGTRNGGLPLPQAVCHLLCAPQHLRGQETSLSPLGFCSRNSLGLIRLPLLRAAKFSFVCALI